MNWYLGVLKNYTGFSGRAHRTEFWMFALISLVIGFVLGMIDLALGLIGPQGNGLISSIYGLAVLLPSVAVGIRRLHDTDRSGLWYLLVFIPILGTIALIVFFAQEGTPAANRFGASPKVAA